MVLCRRLNTAGQRKSRIELAHKFHLQKWMQLHAIFRDANLSVKDIKEAYAFHVHNPCRTKAAKMGLRLRELGDQRLAHLYKMPGLQRAACATAFSGGNFSDHCAAYIIGISQHQVEVMVAMFASFLLPAKQYRFHGIDLLLRAGTLVTEHIRGAQSHKFRNADVPWGEVDALRVIVKDRLNAPSLGPAVLAAGKFRRRRMAQIA